MNFCSPRNNQKTYGFKGEWEVNICLNSFNIRSEIWKRSLSVSSFLMHPAVFSNIKINRSKNCDQFNYRGGASQLTFTCSKSTIETLEKKV